MCVVCSFYRINDFFYSSFLALMQEKKQKKIKASRMPAKYSSSQVGAYCIRPIKRHPTDGECANRINYHDSSFHKWNACRAYAIRPYTGTPKTRRVLYFLPSSNTETRRVLYFLPSSNTETRRVFIFSGRGVLHTPHQTPSHGWRMCKPCQLS